MVALTPVLFRGQLYYLESTLTEGLLTATLELLSG